MNTPSNKGTLFIVATPIGNLEDITLRALRILREADCIVCEDKRVTQKLLAHYDIKPSCLRVYFSHSSLAHHTSIIDDLKAGKSIALVSDAGTPLVSDPGYLLLKTLHRVASDEGSEFYTVQAVPGASSLTSFLSTSPYPHQVFTFLGFAPTKKGRQTWFAQLGAIGHSVVFLESSHRILKTLETLAEIYPEHEVCIGKELTKMYERRITGTTVCVRDVFTRDPSLCRGEFVVGLYPPQ